MLFTYMCKEYPLNLNWICGKYVLHLVTLLRNHCIEKGERSCWEKNMHLQYKFILTYLTTIFDQVLLIFYSNPFVGERF